MHAFIIRNRATNNNNKTKTTVTEIWHNRLPYIKLFSVVSLQMHKDAIQLLLLPFLKVSHDESLQLQEVQDAFYGGESS